MGPLFDWGAVARLVERSSFNRKVRFPLSPVHILSLCVKSAILIQSVFIIT